MTYRMQSILIMFSIILLFSCEFKGEVKHQQEVTELIKRDTSNVGNLHNDTNQTEDNSVSCYFDKLSHQFNASVEVNQINEDSTKISIKIFEKNSKTIIDNIDVQTKWLIIPPMFADCQNVRSLSTGVNIDKEVIDNEHGDFIIADFNFDDLDDFAIAVDFGGNGGTIYSFYLQKSNRKFELDQYLTETILRFPVSFDRKNNTLTTSVHADAYGNSESVYQLRNGKWKQISEKYLKL